MKTIKLLFAETDRTQLRPIVEALRAKGLRVAEGAARRDELVLAVLSAAFYADEASVETLMSLLAAGTQKVLPLQLDGAEIPETLKNALYARNIIPAAGRDAAHTAERIAAAIPPPPPVVTPRRLLAAALVIAAVAGFVIWRTSQSRQAVPAMAEEPAEEVTLPAGWTLEQLSKVKCLIIVGDQMEFYTPQDIMNQAAPITPGWDHFAYRDWDDGPHWYSREDGHEYALTRYDDLDFLTLMPNLAELHLALVDAPELPSLEGDSYLTTVTLSDCEIPDLAWLAGSNVNRLTLFNSTGSVSDLHPLTDCKNLHEVYLDLSNTRRIDWSGFAPPALDWFQIDNGFDLEEAPDLSALSGCTRLRECRLHGLALTDLEFLTKASKLEELALAGLQELRDISALEGLKNLKELRIDGCERLQDYTPISGCTALHTISLWSGDFGYLRDVSFLDGLLQLSDIRLGNVNIPNIDFLRSLGTSGKSVSFSFDGVIGDFSALEACKRYKDLNLNPANGASLDAIMPYLEGATVQNLSLHYFEVVDLSSLPRVINCLEIDNCGLTDLSTTPENWEIVTLKITDCPRLRSLDGLQNQTWLGRGSGELQIAYCPRLFDFSAIEDMSFITLRLTGLFALPSFEGLQTRALWLESIPDVTDLSFLDAMDASRRCSFHLLGLEELQDLTPLRRFHGSMLTVSPQLAEQAEDLVRAGNFSDYRVEYPSGGWEMDEYELTLLSLDELESLPPAALRRVSRLWVAGERIVDPDRYEIWEDWGQRDANDNPLLLLHDRETDEDERIGTGFLMDLSILSELTGLRELRLWGQPVETLDGVQNMSSLEDFIANYCPNLRNASALFTVQSLRQIDLEGCPVESIQGVQNLSELCRLELSRTALSDLSPLAECDFSAACEENGLGLQLNGLSLSEQDFAALSTIRKYSDLGFHDQDPKLWIGALSGSEIEHFAAAGDFDSNEDLETFVADHPELRSLWLGHVGQIDDLSCLCSLEHLEDVSIDADQTRAIASLEGKSYSFELNLID